MREDNDWRVWMVIGALGSVVLAVVLMPLRDLTSASNLAFAFLAFTIIIAELGGRAPALTTALLSAMALNFFLTEPYLTLAINKRDDVIAFFALAVCGLIAAAFGKRRRHLSEAAAQAGQELNILKRLVEQLRERTSLENVLHHLQSSFGLKGIALRDGNERLLAGSPSGSALAIPKTQLNPNTLLPVKETTHRFGVRGLRIPEAGGRLSFQTDHGLISLDLWEGKPEGLDPDESRTLVIAAAVLALELSRRDLR